MQGFLSLSIGCRDEAYRRVVGRSFAISFAVHCRRTSVEREFGRLKHDYGLAFLRIRGIERVRLHADLTIMSRLALALAKTRPIRSDD